MGWWVEPAIRASLELIEEYSPSTIMVTMSPFTAAKAGMRLKKLTGLPLIFDLRDPWALDETKIYPTRWHAQRDWSAMARAIDAADLLIMNTPEAATAVREHFRIRPDSHIISLTNGFDSEDFAATDHVGSPQAAPEVLRVVHTGMFHSGMARVWDDVLAGRGWMNKLKHPRRPINLWTRTPRYLLEAMHRLTRAGAIPRDRIELVLVGELTPEDRQLIESSPAGDQVRMLGYQTHAASVAWLNSADVLFLPLHTPLDGGPSLIVPGKAYEYLASQRPILSMGPPGDMSRTVNQSGCGMAIAGADVAAAEAALLQFYEAKLSGRRLFVPDQDYVNRFHRRELAAALAGELERLTLPQASRLSAATAAQLDTRGLVAQ
jgi:glycosyltransferase involved in cell wall biosynthesis